VQKIVLEVAATVEVSAGRVYLAKHRISEDKKKCEGPRSDQWYSLHRIGPNESGNL
jgi:hypothetical protein